MYKIYFIFIFYVRNLVILFFVFLFGFLIHIFFHYFAQRFSDDRHLFISDRDSLIAWSSWSKLSFIFQYFFRLSLWIIDVFKGVFYTMFQFDRDISS